MAKPKRPASKTTAKPTPSAQSAKPTKPRPGLGKGLGALIGAPRTAAGPALEPSGIPPPQTPTGGPGATPVSDGVRAIAVNDIRRSPWQPRHAFEDAALSELAESIRTHGVLQPLLCRHTGTGIELVAGERRLRAAIAAGLRQVPVIFREVSDTESAEIALVENLQREDLNPIEEAEGYKLLAERFSLTQQDIAERVGKARASVTNALRLLELPDEVRQMLGDGRISAGHAKALLGLPRETDCILLARRCVTDGLSVRGIEQEVRRRTTERAPAQAPQLDLPASHTTALTDRLRRHFGTAVRLAPSGTRTNGRRVKGTLEVDFYDNADLDRIVNLIGISLNDG